MKKFCKKCQSFFEGKAYGEDQICGACKDALERAGFPITAEIVWDKSPKKSSKKESQEEE